MKVSTIKYRDPFGIETWFSFLVTKSNNIISTSHKGLIIAYDVRGGGCDLIEHDKVFNSKHLKTFKPKNAQQLTEACNMAIYEYMYIPNESPRID